MAKKHTNMDPVVHFEMPAEDRNAWQISTQSIWLEDRDVGSRNGRLCIARTTESDESVVQRTRRHQWWLLPRAAINPSNILQW